MKKVLAMMMAMILIVILAACGNVQSTDQQSSDSKSEDKTQSVETSLETDEEKDVSDNDDYPIIGNIVYFKDVLGWSDAGDKIYVHYWSDSDTNMVSWPGSEMESLGNGVFSYELPDGVEYVIFSNGKDKDTQTRDIIYDGSVRKFQASTKQDEVKAHYAIDWDGKELESNKIDGKSNGDLVDVDALKDIEEKDTFKVKVTKKEIQEDGASGISLAGDDLIVLHITNNDTKAISDVTIYVLAYDEDNIAQKISTGTISIGNNEKYIKAFVTEGVTIKPGETTEVAIRTTKGYISGVRCIVESYKMDGEEIENDMVKDWYNHAYVGKNQELD